MKILVTGANGLLGYNLIRELIEDHEVQAVVHSSPEDLVPGVHYHQIDFSGEWCADWLPKQIGTVIHLAQSSRFRDFPEQALDVFSVNVESTARLLDYACRNGVNRFIYASSGGIYGSGSNAFNEDSPIVPPGLLGYYLSSKLCGEVLTRSYASHMESTVLRFFFMYGFRQKQTMLIPRLVDNIKEGRPIPLQGENGIRINPIHVDDAVKAVLAAMRVAPGTTFNIAGPDVLSLREICVLIGEKIGKDPVFEIVPGKPEDLIGDSAAMLKQLCVPLIHFTEGIDDLLG